MSTEVNFPKQRFAGLWGWVFLGGLLLTLGCLIPSPAPAQSHKDPPAAGDLDSTLVDGHDLRRPTPDDLFPTLSPRQKRSIALANLQKSKSDAANLAALAKELREELDKPNVNVLSAEVTNHLDKIAKLAKKIQEETKGY